MNETKRYRCSGEMSLYHFVDRRVIKSFITGKK